MFSSITTFCNLLSKSTDPFIHSSIVESDLWITSHLARFSDWKYLLKKSVSDRLFANFEREGIVNSENTVVCLDPEERVSQCFKYFKSCRTVGPVDRVFCQASNPELDYFYTLLAESLFLLPDDIQSRLLGIFQNMNDFTRVCLDDLVSTLAVDKRNLVQSFIAAAEKVWQFHTLCLSFEPPATIFRVSCGFTFNQQYMESIDALETDDVTSVPTVAFMVYPGFRLRKSIIKSEVYVAIKT